MWIGAVLVSLFLYQIHPLTSDVEQPLRSHSSFVAEAMRPNCRAYRSNSVVDIPIWPVLSKSRRVAEARLTHRTRRRQSCRVRGGKLCFSPAATVQNETVIVGHLADHTSRV